MNDHDQLAWNSPCPRRPEAKMRRTNSAVVLLLSKSALAAAVLVLSSCGGTETASTSSTSVKRTTTTTTTSEAPTTTTTAVPMLVPLPPTTCNDLARSSVANDNMVRAIDGVLEGQFELFRSQTGRSQIADAEAAQITRETTAALLRECDPIVAAAVRDYMVRNPG